MANRALWGASLKARFDSRVTDRPPGQCWPWGGAKTRGYGILTVEGRQRYATHIALEADGRPRPFPTAVALHACDNPACVNPEHLAWGTQGENLKDMREKGRHRRGLCRNGHDLSEVGERETRGVRRCLRCLRDRNRRAKQKRQAEALLLAERARREREGEAA